MSTFSKIILASRSPARKKLIQKLKIPFECHASEINENMNAKKDPRDLAMHLAAQKAEAIAFKYPNSIIIGVDTFVVIGKEKIGKPASVKEAEEIFKKMSGKTIQVISGLAVLKTDAKGEKLRELISNCTTFLTMKKLSPQKIHSRSRRQETIDVSGAITIEKDGDIIESIEGDYNNVIGLPLFQLKKILETLGIKIP